MNFCLNYQNLKRIKVFNCLIRQLFVVISINFGLIEYYFI